MGLPAQTSSATFSEKLAAYICSEQFERIDRAAIEKTKHMLIYHVALAFWGLVEEDDEAMRALAVARELSDGRGSASLLGQKDKATLVDAVFANAQMFGSFGYDDVIRRTGVHPALTILAPALGLGERCRRSGKDLITSIIVGYEIMGKFARWTWTLETPRRSTMVYGTFAGIATASRLLGLDERHTRNAISFAAHTAMGVAEGTGPIEHFYGLICRNSVTGAYLAKAGADTSPTVLEGRYGFYETFLGKVKPEPDEIVSLLGRDYSVMEADEKRYPGTGLNWVPIELMRGIIRDEGITAKDVERFDVDFSTDRQKFAPSYSTGPFLTPDYAISSPWAHMALLLLGRPQHFPEFAKLDDPASVDLLSRCHAHFVPDKATFYAKLKIRTRDGRLIEREGNQEDISFAPEDWGLMMSRGASKILPAAKVDRFLELMENLEQVEDVSELLRCLTL